MAIASVIKSRKIDWTFWLLLLAGISLRIPLLAFKPPHVDEGVNGWFVEEIMRLGYYRYDPANYHGPLHFYILFLFKILFGQNLWALRLPSVCFGMASVLLITRLKDYLGKPAAYLGALFLAVSPGMVFYSRYAIHEPAFLFFSLLAVLGFLRFRTFNDRTSLWQMGLGITGMAVTKEIFILHIVFFLLSFILAGLMDKRWPSGEPIPRRLRQYSRDDCLHVLIVCALIVICLYSGFFLYWRGLAGFFEALAIWSERGLDTSGHAKPFHYWGMLLVRYEWASLLGLFLTWRLFFGSPPFLRFLGLYGWISLGVYSLIPYKTPWLIMNFLWPFTLVAASFLSEIALRSKSYRVAAFLLGALLVASASWKSVALNFYQATEEKEPYVYVQTLRPIMEVRDKLHKVILAEPGKRHMRIVVLMDNYWPLPWLLGRFTNVAYSANLSKYRNAAVIFCDVKQQKLVEQKLRKKYFVKQIPLRSGRGDILVYFEESVFSGFLDKDMRAVRPAPRGAVVRGGGLQARYFSNPEWLGPAVFEDSVDSIDFYWEGESRPFGTSFSMILEGEIFIPETGVRTFFLTSDDGSDLRVGRDFTVDNMGVHAELRKSGSALLERGWYPIKVRFFDVGGGAVLRLAWRKDGGAEEIISPEYFRTAKGKGKTWS